jgi:predicted ATPase with chaperone activity
VGLIGGSQVPRPDEVSRAHHGVLWLDERPGCRRDVLEVLCHLIEISVTRRRTRERSQRRRTHGTGRMGNARVARHEGVSARL